MKTKTLTRLAMLTAVALALGWLESFLAIAPTIPGIKLGLANTVLLYALYLMDTKSTIILMVLKVLLSALLYAGFGTALFSLGGGLLSLAAMAALRRLKGFSIIGVSVMGAVCHNLGQLLVAAFVVNTRAMLAYFPVLMVAGVVTGILTGVCAKYAIAALSRRKEET